MKQIFYALEFTGSAAPVSGSSTVLKATTTAASCQLTTIINSEGIRSALQLTPGGSASFESEVTLTGDASFQESGVIRFGDGPHRLRFSTVGQGYLGPSADPRLKHGSVMWRVEGGEGQFAGASGLITSNFTISETGEVTDRHWGVIFVS